MLGCCIGSGTTEAVEHRGDAWHRCYQDIQKAENEALSRLTGGCQTQGDRLASTLSPTPRPQGARGLHSPRMLVGIPSRVWSMSWISRYRWIT